MRLDWKAALKRVGWMIAVLVTGAIVISAVEQKEGAASFDLLVDVTPLREGTFLVNEADVRKIIQKNFGSDLVGEELEQIDVEQLESLLESEPFILDAEAFVDARNRVRVKVEQRKPLLRILDQNGLNYYLDEFGVQMPLSAHYAARVLVATGNIPPYAEDFAERDKHLLKDLFRLTRTIMDDPFIYALAEQIHVRNGAFLLIPKVGDQKILLGDADELEDKFSRLKLFYQEGMTREGWNKYETINLAYKDQVVCNLK